ncbi:HAD hydrolase-like protein [Kribbella capetownensis]|uniref:HAD hydrolase-like protein n=1 Tax=Kribbella capetownensis TaxID=1572659 RepID=UPI001EDE68EA|nr:HAD hydrolase-like protein [Kribbella capetownensis]
MVRPQDQDPPVADYQLVVGRHHRYAEPAVHRVATNLKATVTGKPGTALFDLARSRLGSERSETIMVGDRLDTDIAGASAAGVDSMLVLGGASTLRDLVFAEDDARPTYFGFDLSGLLQPGLCQRPGPDDAVELSSDGVLSVRRPVARHRLLRAILQIGPPVECEGTRDVPGCVRAGVLVHLEDHHRGVVQLLLEPVAIDQHMLSGLTPL